MQNNVLVQTDYTNALLNLQVYNLSDLRLVAVAQLVERNVPAAHANYMLDPAHWPAKEISAELHTFLRRDNRRREIQPNQGGNTAAKMQT